MAAPSQDHRPTPLLNEYKHVLSRRRFLQTLTGGVKIRRAPWYIHVVQLLLWTAPTLLCVPFIILESLRVWSPYFLALVYGCMVGLGVLVLDIIGVCVRYCASSVTDTEGINPQLDDEDSVDFSGSSCFHLEKFDFIFAKRKLHGLLLHPLVSGLLSFSGCFILFPGVLQESLSIAGVVVVSIFGWFTLCNAHYSLTAGPPHETAVYRPTDPLELKFLMRPFYVLAIAVAFFPIRLVVSQPTLYLQLLYALLCLLPLGWLCGVLPPLDALLPWAMEQAVARLMGGSPMATDLRLFVMFTASAVSVVIVAALTDRSTAVLLGTAFGFLLSHDVFLIPKVLSCSFASKVYTAFHTAHFHPVLNIKTYLISIAIAATKGTVLLSISLVIAYFTFAASGGSEDLARTIVAALLIGLYCFMQLAHCLQGIYIVRFFRNPLHPHNSESVEKFQRKRQLLSYISVPTKLMATYVLPVLMVAYAGLGLETEETAIPHIWFGIAAARILRKIWQSTPAAHLELSIVAILHLALPPDSRWAALGLGTQTLIIGLALEIAASFCRKLIFGAQLFISFLIDKKQRVSFPLTVTIGICSIVFLPLVFSTLLLSSLLSTPLLPLFTLPVFFVSFPRTKRFWPSLANYGSSYSACEDSVYYQQAVPEIARALFLSISTGAVSAEPGSFLLLRFQDRLAIATILEIGFGFCTLSIRGLELQETSCHTTEATRIDDIFEGAYGHESKSPLEFWFNKHILNVMQPLDSSIIHTYSDARNVLTGIIDQPPALERFSDNLLKCIVWVAFLYFSANSKTYHDGYSSHSEKEQVPVQRVHSDSGFVSGEKCLQENTQVSNQQPLSPRQGVNANCTDPDTLSWSDSISSLGDNTKPVLPTIYQDMAVFSPDLQAADSIPGLIPEDRPLETSNTCTRVFSETTIDDGAVQPETRISVMPGKAIADPTSGGLHKAIADPTSGGLHKEQKTRGIRIRFSTKIHPEECETVKGMPESWTKLPLQYGQVSKLMRKFPHDWLKFVKESTGTDFQRGPKNEEHQEMDQNFMRLVMVCFSLMDVPCSSQHLGKMARTEPYDIYNGFCGEFPYSSNLDWLTEKELLNSLMLKAYRYTVRLMYDEASLGEADNNSELVEYLQDYDDSYFIGSESEPGWKESILMQKPHLFSLGRDPEQDVYTAHVLTLQNEVVHMGLLNCEAVAAVWTDLAWELLYLTNDDEERYSIQAHPTLLRNLTIQAADPPLGYCVYSSGIVTIPHV